MLRLWKETLRTIRIRVKIQSKHNGIDLIVNSKYIIII
jgi:hypothetical protein